MESSPVSDVPPVDPAEEGGLRGGRQFTATESDLRLEDVLPLLHRRFQTLLERHNTPHRYVIERQGMEGDIKSVLQTPSADLLEHIMSAFFRADYEHQWSEATHLESSPMYDRQLNTRSMVQDIKALQAKLDATKDEGEQRALQEDITGQILWLFWCGICSEVDELLPKVVDYIRREVNIEGLLDIYDYAFNPSTDPVDDQVHLERIMYDAGANSSKYQLWLDARAREQAKWSSTNKGTPTVANQGTTPSTSRQTPPASVVHTTAASVLPQTPTRKRRLSQSHGTNAGADDEVASTDTRRLKRQT